MRHDGRPQAVRRVIAQTLEMKVDGRYATSRCILLRMISSIF
jgi:hypothetical protein